MCVYGVWIISRGCNRYNYKTAATSKLRQASAKQLASVRTTTSFNNKYIFNSLIYALYFWALWTRSYIAP